MRLDLDLGKSVEMRYELLSLSADPEAREEMEKIGHPPGERPPPCTLFLQAWCELTLDARTGRPGSPERASWFQKWAEDKQASSGGE